MTRKSNKAYNSTASNAYHFEKDALREYVEHNEVVFQSYGDLIEIANSIEIENKENLLRYITVASNVEVYEKDHFYIKEDFSYLNTWAKEDDILFLLQPIGILICITKKDALDYNLIAA